jgi:CelD/BcsL family acetyltransferase involved in cellulose biosynthesis
LAAFPSNTRFTSARRIMSITVDRISSLSDLQQHREAWNDLARRTPRAQFFQTYDWFATYWKHFGKGQRMEVLFVADGSQLVGIVPLIIRSERRRVGNVRVLTYPLDDWGSFFGPVTTDPQRTISATINYVAEQIQGWDVFSWRWLADGDDAATAVADEMARAGMRVFPLVRGTTAVIDLPKKWDDYLASRSSKFRNNLRRWRRRVSEKGTLRFEKYRPGGEQTGDTDPRWDLYDTCERLAERSWQGSSETGTTLSHDSVRPFLRDVHREAATLGAADVNLMYLDDAPVAFEYGYWWQGYKYSLRFGYDGGLCRIGVGNLMWLDTIAASVAAGDHTVDMGPGSLEYKRHFMTRTADCLTLEHYRRSAPKAQAIAVKQILKSWWSPATPVS